MTREDRERTLRKTIAQLTLADDLLRSVAAERDAYFQAADKAAKARQTVDQARCQAATSLGLLITHND